MSPNQLMIERAKELILRDCLDSICEAKQRIINHFKKPKNKSSRDYICGIPDSTIYLDEAVTEALKELVLEGNAVKVGGKYRAKLNFEKQQESLK